MSIAALSIAELIERDLDRLSTEIESYKSEEVIWQVQAGITNSAGNLALHLCGNLQHFIGAVIGKSGYVRDREFEFNGKHVPKAEMLDSIKATKAIVKQTLHGITESTLNGPYPVKVFGDKEMSTLFFLMHLQGHLNYHLGQINYHRRLLDQ
jgi:uncharacterized damage-inducible protein DinB